LDRRSGCIGALPRGCRHRDTPRRRLIFAATSTPAGVPERDALPALKDDLDEKHTKHIEIDAPSIDRGTSPATSWKSSLLKVAR
jgi:hypothetical protein